VPFYGAVVALVLVTFANVYNFHWTNPNDPSLKEIVLRAQAEGSPDTLCLGHFRGRQTDDMVPPSLKPGRADSSYVTFPPAPRDSVKWTIWWYWFKSDGTRSSKMSGTVWVQRRGQ
jgi:hypothetical protein